MPEDKERIMNILQANKNKLFVKRVLNPSIYPEISNKDKTVSTHKMAWGEADGRYFVYPTILMEDGKLKEFDDEEAFNEAIKRGEFIEFDNPEEADWFSKSYKKVWK